MLAQALIQVREILMDIYIFNCMKKITTKIYISFGINVISQAVSKRCDFFQHNVCKSNYKNHKSKTKVKILQSLCNIHGRHGGIYPLILNLSIRKTRALTLKTFESRWTLTATGDELPSLKTLAVLNGL
jgi:hypothetical protein